MPDRAAQGLRVLVTSGGTFERIDRVRRITNTSTGRLGSLIADEFAREGAGVVFVCGEDSMRPALKMESIHAIGGVAQLSDTLERLLGEQSFDCVVHAMAVSDYSVRAVTTAGELAKAVLDALISQGVAAGDEGAPELARTAIRNARRLSGNKLSSSVEDMALLMERTPKVIEAIKRLQPRTILVGFKLLAGVSEQELADAAMEQIGRTGADFVLANDLDSISGDIHKALLIQSTGNIIRMETKQDIAAAIVRCIAAQKGRRAP